MASVPEMIHGQAVSARNRADHKIGPWRAIQRIRLRPAWGWRIRRFLGSKGHVVGMLFAIIGILLLNNGLTNGVVGLGLVLLLYGTGYFFASRPQHEALALAGAKDAPEIHDGLDEILATIRPRVADDIYYRVRSIRDAIVFTLETPAIGTRSTRASHMVRQTATTYLPEALSTYPGAARGRTPSASASMAAERRTTSCSTSST